MSAGKAALLSPPSAAATGASPSLNRPHGWLAAALVLLVAMYFSTAQSIMWQWWTSPTFNHGFLIVPVSIWLIWLRRGRLAAVPRKPWPPALWLLAALGGMWLLATVGNVQVVRQYCLVLMAITLVAAVQGVRYAMAAAFPLAYLLLAVPFGEVFIPPLIDFTARFTVTLLQWCGIPVYHENNFIALPTGNWAVADACSGLRYLVASLALGMVYACISYRSLGKQWVFVLISIVLPILANGLRACMVVLIGHWSNMRLAAGVDHLIYGWVFFGLVMALLFWCGARWRDPPWPPQPAVNTAESGPVAAAPAEFAKVTAAAIAVLALWPLLAAHLLRPPETTSYPARTLTLAPPPPPWRAAPMRAGDWHVLHAGQPQRISSSYSDGRRSVSLQLTWYAHQTRGAELLTQVRRTVVSGRAEWEEVASMQREIMIAGRRIPVRQSVRQAAEHKLMVWAWYRLDGKDTGSAQRVKLQLAKAKLFGSSDAGAEIVVTTGYDDDARAAEATLEDFLTAMLPAIERGLQHVSQ